MLQGIALRDKAHEFLKAMRQVLPAFTVLLLFFQSACLIAILVVVSRRPSSPQIDWEYRVVVVYDALFEPHMNALGEDGWEMAFARRAADLNDNINYEIIFKRPTSRRK